MRWRASRAVKCCQSRLARIAHTAVGKFGHHRDDVEYCCMPLFHGNALMALWAPALTIERVLRRQPAVIAAGVYAVPDPRSGIR